MGRPANRKARGAVARAASHLVSAAGGRSGNGGTGSWLSPRVEAAAVGAVQAVAFSLQQSAGCRSQRRFACAFRAAAACVLALCELSVQKVASGGPGGKSLRRQCHRLRWDRAPSAGRRRLQHLCAVATLLASVC
jgi:hypothetical protein